MTINVNPERPVNRHLIDRDPTLTEDDDYLLNVQPLLTEGMVSEKLLHWDLGETTEDFRLAGWWIIPVDFHEKLQAAIDAEEDSPAQPSAHPPDKDTP